MMPSQIIEEFQELREADSDSERSNSSIISNHKNEIEIEKDNGVSDSSEDGVTDKEAPTPPVQSTPPR